MKKIIAVLLLSIVLTSCAKDAPRKALSTITAQPISEGEKNKIEMECYFRYKENTTVNKDARKNMSKIDLTDKEIKKRIQLDKEIEEGMRPYYEGCVNNNNPSSCLKCLGKDYNQTGSRYVTPQEFNDFGLTGSQYIKQGHDLHHKLSRIHHSDKRERNTKEVCEKNFEKLTECRDKLMGEIGPYFEYKENIFELEAVEKYCLKDCQEIVERGEEKEVKPCLKNCQETKKATMKTYFEECQKDDLSSLSSCLKYLGLKEYPEKAVDSKSVEVQYHALVRLYRSDECKNKPACEEKCNEFHKCYEKLIAQPQRRTIS